MKQGRSPTPADIATSGNYIQSTTQFYVISFFGT